MDIFSPSMFEFVAQPFLPGILLYEVLDLDLSLQLDFGVLGFCGLKIIQKSFPANF